MNDKINNKLLEKLILKIIENEPSTENEIEKDFSCPWEINKNYFIRTVTMHLVGEVIAVSDKEIILEKASWVADSGRFNNALKTGVFEEVEPFINKVIVNRGAVVDATMWDHGLPDYVK